MGQARGSYWEAEVLVSVQEASGARDVVALLNLRVAAVTHGNIQEVVVGAKGADGSGRGCHSARLMSKCNCVVGKQH